VRADTEIPKENADASPKNTIKKGLRVTLAIAAFINAPVKVTCSISTRFRTLRSKGHTVDWKKIFRRLDRGEQTAHGHD
jgi:hypothetical protein